MSAPHLNSRHMIHTSTQGALMYHAVADCNARYGIPCPPYVNGKDLACVVCSK